MAQNLLDSKPLLFLFLNYRSVVVTETHWIALLSKLLKQKVNNQIGMILTDQEYWKDCGQCFQSNIHPFVMDCYFHSATFKVMRLIAQRAMMSKLFCQSGTQFSIFVGQLDIQTVSSNRREERITLVNKTLKKVMINGCHVCVVFILLCMVLWRRHCSAEGLLHLVTVKEDGFCCLFPVEHENAEINTTCTADIEVACTAGMVTVADFHYANRFNDDNDDDTPRWCKSDNLYLFRCHRLY